MNAHVPFKGEIITRGSRLNTFSAYESPLIEYRYVKSKEII
jgi:hypothetical protein